MTQADELKTTVQEYKTIQQEKVDKVEQAVRDIAATRQEQTGQPVPTPTPSP